ncbi:MAG TPA: leucyl aminopeptidase family protein [Niabella sp.]|nr:leucyl aminopeptidase family protein [Chitinophagaceae bacterium]HUN03195.1 leucyl aminopeptidase family protein [Niabella sp.]
MIKISSKKVKTTQRFYVFTQESWSKAKKQFELAQKFFEAKKSEVFITSIDNAVCYLIGVGKEAQAKDFVYQQVGNKFSSDFKEKINPTATEIVGSLNEKQLSQFVLGLFLGTYKYPFEKTHPFWKKGFSIVSNAVSEKQAKVISLRTEAICSGQFAGMEWLNKPANYKTVSLLSKYLKEECKKLNISYKSFNRAVSIRKGLGAFVAVNQGSSQEAAFTILEYKGGGPKSKTLGLVGKCVLFDTGGISIKPSENMHYMKSDMGGAAAVIGALFAIAELKMPVNIVAVLPITDNAVSEKAYLPSDVITAYNGKTIEVLNTDAEGRMTLADGLSYLSKNYKTDVLIDLATLTGSAVRMFGYSCGAYFSNNEELKGQLEKSAGNTHQRIWNLPLWVDWQDEIKSDVADYRNISSKPFGDCIVAAKFLEQFIEGHRAWAHLDIAGVAFGNVNYAKEKAATGYGVQMLIDFAENFVI